MCLGVPMKITELLPDSLAKVLAGSVSLTISTQLIENPAIGEHVIVHAGFAIEKMNEAAVDETMKLLHELADVSEGLDHQLPRRG